MNLSSDDSPFSPVPSAHANHAPLEYVPMEYDDARAQNPETPLADNADSAAISEPVAASGPSVEELLKARIEEARSTITAQVRQESEREMQRVRAGVTTALDQFAHQRDEYFLQVESEVVQLALAIARRLIHRETQVDPHLLAGLVNYELEQLEQSTAVRLLVSSDALKRWNELLASLSRPVELAPDKTLSAFEVRIETALGSATVSFEHELKEIEHGFFDLLSHRPASPESVPARVQ